MVAKTAFIAKISEKIDETAIIRKAIAGFNDAFSQRRQIPASSATEEQAPLHRAAPQLGTIKLPTRPKLPISPTNFKQRLAEPYNLPAEERGEASEQAGGPKEPEAQYHREACESRFHAYF